MNFPPQGSCDCHVHGIGPKARFPLAEPRAHTPVDAPCETLKNSRVKLGIARAVLVQTSIFGTDNSCLLGDLAQIVTSKASGVAAPDADISGSQFDRWHQLGIRGIRLNLTTTGTPPVNVIRQKVASILPICHPNVTPKFIMI